MEKQDYLSENQTLAITCDGCGGKYVYSAEKKKLVCENCGNTQDVGFNNNLVAEKSLTKALEGVAYLEPQQNNKKVFECSGCGAQTMIEQETVNFICRFCGSKNLNKEAFKAKCIQPNGIIPFVIPKNNAVEEFKKWIGKGWLTPGDLKKFAKIENIHGVYVPFYTYDANTFSSYSGDAGHYYYEDQSYTDSKGNSQTRSVRKIRWEHKSGTHSQFFNDILVSASKGIKQKRADEISPYELSKVQNFEPKLLMGWESEVYSVELKEGFDTACAVMDNTIDVKCRQLIGGDTQRDVEIQTQRSNLTYKHIILPAWISSYQYKGKSFQFLVNGQTGKTGGDKPLSTGKIILLIIGGLILAAVLYYLYKTL